MLAQGQTLKITDDKLLFSILGTSAGGDGRTTFMLPAPKFGLIVAIAGTSPSSPKVLASMNRQTSALDLAGAGRTARTAAHGKSTVRGAAGRPAPPHVASSRPGRRDRSRSRRSWPPGSDRAGGNAREAALAALSAVEPRHASMPRCSAPSTQSTNVNEAVSTMTSALTDAEASALVRINDAMIGAFNNRWAGDSGQNVRLEAAVFLIRVSITREQSRAMYARELAAGG